MKTANILVSSVTFSLLLALSTYSSASNAQGNVYLGLSAGKANFSGFEDECDELLNEANLIPGISADCKIDDSDTALLAVVGWRFNRAVAVELGYADLGELTADVTASSGGLTAVGKASAKISGITLSALLGFPLSESGSIYLKLGVLDGDVKAKASASVTGVGSIADSASEDGTEAIYGLGVDYFFNENIGVRGAIDRHNLDEEVDVISLGVLAKF